MVSYKTVNNKVRNPFATNYISDSQGAKRESTQNQIVTHFEGNIPFDDKRKEKDGHDGAQTHDAGSEGNSTSVNSENILVSEILSGPHVGEPNRIHLHAFGSSHADQTLCMGLLENNTEKISQVPNLKEVMTGRTESSSPMTLERSPQGDIDIQETTSLMPCIPYSSEDLSQAASGIIEETTLVCENKGVPENVENVTESFEVQSKVLNPEKDITARKGASSPDALSRKTSESGVNVQGSISMPTCKPHIIEDTSQAASARIIEKSTLVSENGKTSLTESCEEYPKVISNYPTAKVEKNEGQELLGDHLSLSLELDWSTDIVSVPKQEICGILPLAVRDSGDSFYDIGSLIRESMLVVDDIETIDDYFGTSQFESGCPSTNGGLENFSQGVSDLHCHSWEESKPNTQNVTNVQVHVPHIEFVTGSVEDFLSTSEGPINTPGESDLNNNASGNEKCENHSQPWKILRKRTKPVSVNISSQGQRNFQCRLRKKTTKNTRNIQERKTTVSRRTLALRHYGREILKSGNQVPKIDCGPCQFLVKSTNQVPCVGNQDISDVEKEVVEFHQISNPKKMKTTMQSNQSSGLHSEPASGRAKETAQKYGSFLIKHNAPPRMEQNLKLSIKDKRPDCCSNSAQLPKMMKTESTMPKLFSAFNNFISSTNASRSSTSYIPNPASETSSATSDAWKLVLQQAKVKRKSR